MGERCVSCNQSLPHEHVNPNITLKQSENTSDKISLKNLQEYSNKFNTGYSKIINSINSEVFEDMSKVRKNGHNHANSVNFLPDINNKSHSSIKYHNISSNNINTISTNKNSTISPITERKKNTIILNQLDKKIVKGESLIKSVDRLYDTIEKK